MRWARAIFLSANSGEGAGENLALNRAYHETNLLLRARTGKLWIVVANAADPTGAQACYCSSAVLAPDGTWAITVSPHGEQFFAHTIEIDTGASVVAPASDQTAAAASGSQADDLICLLVLDRTMTHVSCLRITSPWAMGAFPVAGQRPTAPRARSQSSPRQSPVAAGNRHAPDP